MGDDVNMYAIEFETDVQQGVIRIPFQYQARVSAHVKVIILQEKEAQADRLRQLPSFEHAMGFDAIAIDTTQWKFRRTEIYECRERV